MQQNEITQELSDEKIDINVAIDNSKISSLLNAVNSAKFKDSEISLNKEEKFIPSQWEWLDRKLGGGFLETGRSLYLFAGQTNVGKSIFLGNIACNVAAQGKTVVLISLEMSELMYAKRISSNVTQIPINELQDNSSNVKQKVVNYQNIHLKY
mgnify:CR=1 FL=1